MAPEVAFIVNGAIVAFNLVLLTVVLFISVR